MISVLDRLREIANRASRPVMDYDRAVAYSEQRDSLDWIARQAAIAIKELTEVKVQNCKRCGWSG